MALDWPELEFIILAGLFLGEGPIGLMNRIGASWIAVDAFILKRSPAI